VVDPSALATWANAITVSRLLLAPLMIWLVPDGTQGSWPAFVLWLVLCGSDAVDGHIARKHGTTTSGAFLDPLADKVLVLGAMFALVDSGQFAILPVVIIAARELGISVYRTFVAARGVSVPASPLAKLKTLTQQLAVAFAIAPPTSADATWLWQTMLWVAVALSVVSGLQYVWRSYRPQRYPVDIIRSRG
jgi:CDP-diacylglycerol---glycerol-3-phosphate 3-phosphatidyltransferase